MTFCEQVRQELLRVKPEKPCCALSELSALTQACGSLILRGGGHIHVRYSMENPALAKMVFLLLKSRLGITPVVQHQHSPRFGGRRILTLSLYEQDARRLMIALKMLRPGDSGDVFRPTPHVIPPKRCCRQAFLRGAFLGSGAMASPERAYHLEFSLASAERAEALQRLLSKCGVEAHAVARRGATVVYVKSGDQVADVLSLMGAFNARMAFENIRITNSSRGQANRALNCDAANVRRQLSAAMSQAELLRAFAAEKGLNTLSAPLAEIARLRIQNPDVSLEQLGALANPPIGKSGVSNRLRRLMKMIKS